MFCRRRRGRLEAFLGVIVSASIAVLYMFLHLHTTHYIKIKPMEQHQFLTQLPGYEEGKYTNDDNRDAEDDWSKKTRDVIVEHGEVARSGLTRHVDDQTDVATQPNRDAIDRSEAESKSGGDGDSDSISTLSRHDNKKYLFPLIEYNWNGPGWWMGQLREAVKVALHFNRTVVFVPMKTHYLDSDPNRMVPFERTFDKDALSKVLPVATIEEYLKVCGDHMSRESLIIDPFFSSKDYNTADNYDAYRTVYGRLFHLILPDSSSMPSTQAEYRERLSSLETEKCVALYHPHRIVISLPNDQVLTNNAARGLAKASYVREIVDHIEESICGGDPFVAMHWRNKTGEKYLTLPDPEVKARALEELKRMSRLSPEISDVIVDYMHSLNLSCLYLSHPPFPQQIAFDLRSRIPSQRIIGKVDIIRFDVMAPYVNDTYTFSLIEQEICFRAKVYLPWFTFGSWSSNIHIERTAYGRPNIFLGKLPGMPQEARSFD
ncbi:uncharacterized protein [Ptychodera flava]